VTESAEFQEKIQEGLVIHPGDKLLLRVHPATLREDVAALAATLRERFPEAEITVVAAEQLAVMRQ
jgi:hypothetical protein